MRSRTQNVKYRLGRAVCFAFALLTALFIASNAQAEDAQLVLQAEGGLGVAGLYRDIYGSGTATGFGVGAKFTRFSWLVKFGQIQFSKIEKDSVAGRFTYENAISMYNLDLEYEITPAIRTSIGYGRMNHTEHSLLYEELIPGTEQATSQTGTLVSPEDFVAAGLMYVLPMNSAFELNFGSQYNRGLKNDLNLLKIQIGLRYVYK